MRRRPRTCSIVVGAVLLLAACASNGAETPPTSDARAGDLGFLAAQIRELHPDPFHHLDKAQFEARVVDDPGRADELLVAAARLANLDEGEGHGGVYPWAQASLEAWPLHLYWFPDGIRVVGGDGVAVGSRLVRVGDAPVDEVMAAVRPLVAHDNDATIASRAPAYVTFPDVLTGLGFDASTLTWELPDGTTATEAPPRLVPAGAFAQLLGLFQPQVPPTLPYDRERAFWSEQTGDVLYVRWNQVRHYDSTTRIEPFSRSLVDAVRNGGARKVIVDVRHNPGGDIAHGRAMAAALREIESERPGTVRVLIGRGTFSAASHVLAGVLHEVDLHVVGEPSGGSPQSYADPRAVTLPASGIVAHVNTRLYTSGGAAWGSIEPDVVVPMTYADWAAGRDPVREAAVSF